MSHGSRGVLRNAAALLIGRALGQIVRAVAVLWAAAHLGPGGWGVFGYLVASLDIFKVLTNFGLDTAAIRAFALSRDAPRATERAVATLKVGTAALGFVLVAIVALLASGYQGYRGWMILLGVTLLPQAFTATLTARFQAEHAMERLIVVQIVTGVVYLGAVYLLVHAGSGVGGFIVLLVVLELVSLLATFGIWRRTFARAAATATSAARGFRATLAPLVRQAVPLGAVELLSMVYSRLGVFLLEHFHGHDATGRFYAAMKIADPLVIIGGAIAISALPVLSRLAAEHRTRDVVRLFVRYSVGSAVLACVLAAIVSFYSADVLRLLRPQYVAGAPALSALAWATAFMLQNQLSSTVLYAYGKFHYVAACAAFNLLVCIALGLWLVPMWGVAGAGLAALGTEGLNAIVQLTLVAKVLRAARKGALA